MMILMFYSYSSFSAAEPDRTSIVLCERLNDSAKFMPQKSLTHRSVIPDIHREASSRLKHFQINHIKFKKKKENVAETVEDCNSS